MADEEAEKRVFYIGICGALTLLAGLMSGLTLVRGFARCPACVRDCCRGRIVTGGGVCGAGQALMSMDQVDLQVRRRPPSPALNGLCFLALV